MDFHVRVDHVSAEGQVPDGDGNLLARFNVPVSLDPTNISSSFGIYRDIRNQGPHLRLGFQLNCTEGYFGPACTKVCYAQDDEEGHYTCDGQGNIVCMSGFQNVLTNCTECVLSPGCCELVVRTCIHAQLAHMWIAYALNVWYSCNGSCDVNTSMHVCACIHAYNSTILMRTCVYFRQLLSVTILFVLHVSCCPYYSMVSVLVSLLDTDSNHNKMALNIISHFYILLHVCNALPCHSLAFYMHNSSSWWLLQLRREMHLSARVHW